RPAFFYLFGGGVGRSGLARDDVTDLIVAATAHVAALVVKDVGVAAAVGFRLRLAVERDAAPIAAGVVNLDVAAKVACSGVGGAHARVDQDADCAEHRITFVQVFYERRGDRSGHAGERYAAAVDVVEHAAADGEVGQRRRR